MAAGDVTFFNESLATMLDGNWSSTDVMKVAILDNTTAPSASTTTPSLSDFTEVGTAGTYIAGGTSLGTWGDFISQAGGTVTFDSVVNPSWAQHGSNDADVYWALIYNDTQAGNDALAFVDLGGPINMSAGSLTITWNASGIATLS